MLLKIVPQEKNDSCGKKKLYKNPVLRYGARRYSRKIRKIRGKFKKKQAGILQIEIKKYMFYR